MEASDGEAAALLVIASARRLAPARGEARAASSDDGSATPRAWVKDSGERSLMVRDSSGVGSCVVDFRMFASGGSKVGKRGGMLSSGPPRMNQHSAQTAVSRRPGEVKGFTMTLTSEL